MVWVVCASASPAGPDFHITIIVGVEGSGYNYVQKLAPHPVLQTLGRHEPGSTGARTIWGHRDAFFNIGSYRSQRPLNNARH